MRKFIGEKAFNVLLNILNSEFTRIIGTINDLKKSVSDGKKSVADAITAKGVQTATNANFATMAENISKIKTTAKLQDKSAVLDTGTTSVTLTPDSGYDGLGSTTTKIELQQKTAALSTAAQNVTPDNGKVLSKVVVPAVGGTAGTGDVLSGKTFSSAAGINKIGAMANKGGTTVDAGAVTQDDNYIYLSVPAAGYYDTNSKLRSANSDLNLAKGIDYVMVSWYLNICRVMVSDGELISADLSTADALITKSGKLLKTEGTINVIAVTDCRYYKIDMTDNNMRTGTAKAGDVIAKLSSDGKMAVCALRIN